MCFHCLHLEQTTTNCQILRTRAQRPRTRAFAQSLCMAQLGGVFLWLKIFSEKSPALFQPRFLDFLSSFGTDGGRAPVQDE